MSIQDPPGSQSDDTSSAPPDSNISSADSLSYWSNVSSDVNGMLGGFPQISRIDLQGSKNFIVKTRRILAKSTSTPSSNSAPIPPEKLNLIVDCGAGIGRITLGLLIDLSHTVDIVEPTAKFASVLQSHPLHTQPNPQIGSIYTTSLESWHPTQKYDLIWNQWCVGYLNDTQLTDYLRRAGQALTDGGWICVKENLSTHAFGEDIFDEADSSVTRSDGKFRSIFEEAGLKLVRSEVQTGFSKKLPKGLRLYPVKMYALRPT